METTQVIKKVGKSALNILLYFFIVVSVLGIILTVSSKKDMDGTATIFGRQMRIVTSPSMEKSDATDVSGFDIKDIPTRSMVFIDVVPEDPEEAAKWYEELEIGDVLTFKYVYVKQETITHRIVDKIATSDGGYEIHLEGDNKDADDDVLTQIIYTADTNSPNYVIGKVTGQSYIFGVVMSALRSTLGLILIIIVPSLLIVIYEVLKIVRVINADKRKREHEERVRQQSEIDELRRRLAELEGAPSQNTDTPETVTGTSASVADGGSANDGNNG